MHQEHVWRGLLTQSWSGIIPVKEWRSGLVVGCEGGLRTCFDDMSSPNDELDQRSDRDRVEQQ